MAGKKSKPEDKKLLGRRDFLKIGVATAASALLSEMFISGPLSTEAVKGIGRATHPGEASGEYEWHMGINLAECIG